jgi:predicted AlkP superfamily phosphohydrolase/phosphomutase
MRTDERRRQQLRVIFQAEAARTAAFLQLSGSRPCDFRMIVYGATDQVQHHFWHFMDPRHDKHDPLGAKEFEHAIRDTYVHIDQQLERILDDCGDDMIVIVMSDHGFGPTSNVRLRLNQVLHDAGLLQFAGTSGGRSVMRNFAGWLDALLRSTLSADTKRTLSGLFPRLRVWFENLDEAKVSWEQTAAYVNETFRSSPAVWIKNGVSQNGEHDGRVLRQVEEVLASLRDPITGERVISNFYRPQEIYDGPHTDRAPNLLPSWWEDGFLLDQSVPGRDRPPNVERSTTPIRGGVEFAASHRLDGVFVASGGPIRTGAAITNARIIDVAPTVLYLMGLPIPSDMDGRVLTEALDEEFVASNPISWEDAGEGDGDELPQDVRAFSEHESELIAKRLQALGYIN